MSSIDRTKTFFCLSQEDLISLLCKVEIYFLLTMKDLWNQRVRTQTGMSRYTAMKEWISLIVESDYGWESKYMLLRPVVNAMRQIGISCQVSSTDPQRATEDIIANFNRLHPLYDPITVAIHEVRISATRLFGADPKRFLKDLNASDQGIASTLQALRIWLSCYPSGTQDRLERLLALHQWGEELLALPLPWKIKYDIIFGGLIKAIEETGFAIDWYDPDTTYEEDARAYIREVGATVQRLTE